MATLSGETLNLIDWAKSLDPDGNTADVVEMLAQSNEILMDMRWKEGNLPTGHRTTVRTGLPSVYWRLLNQGVSPSKGTTAQVDEACGILEAWSEVDVDLCKLNGNTAAFRLSQAKGFIEAMNQEMAQTLFYGAASSPEEFIGLAARYSSTTAANGANVVSGGGSGSDNSSIWLVGWGDMSVHGIFPKGSKAGLVHDDFGEETVETSAAIGGTRLRAYRERWQWKCGVALQDWRYVVRIPNIDISALVAASSAADLFDKMTRATHRIFSLKNCSPVWYMNRTCFQELDIQRRGDVQAGGGLSYDNVDGKMQYSFRGIPIRICDALTETEATVS